MRRAIDWYIGTVQGGIGVRGMKEMNTSPMCCNVLQYARGREAVPGSETRERGHDRGQACTRSIDDRMSQMGALAEDVSEIVKWHSTQIIL